MNIRQHQLVNFPLAQHHVFLELGVPWRRGAALALACSMGASLGAHAQTYSQTDALATPSGLEHLIIQAIDRHPDISAARAEQLATQADLEVANQRRYPSPAMQLRNDKDGQVVVASLTQPVWTGGRLAAAVNLADRRARAASLAVQESSYHLSLRVLAAWTALRQALGRERAHVDNVALLTVYAESVGRRIAGGASAAVDGELVAARLEQAHSDLSSARAARRLARAQLVQVTDHTNGGVDIEALLPNDLHLLELPLLLPSSSSHEHLQQEATAYSPTLRRLEFEIEAMRYEVDLRRAGLLPSLHVRLEHQRRHANSPHAVSNDSRIALTMEYAPDAGLALNSAISAAQFRAGIQQDRRESYLRDFHQQLLADHEDYQEGLSRALSLQRTLAANRAVLASYDRLLIAGRRGWLEVLNIARDVTATQIALLDARVLAESAGYRLRLHTGKLLQTSTKAPT
jgi:adhesin transport system outer membrane protein